MEDKTKSKASCVLQLGILLNLTLTLLSVGYLTYKVQTLDEKMVRMERDIRVERKTDVSDDHKNRKPRATNGSNGNQASCTKCKELCGQLFSFGSQSQQNQQSSMSKGSPVCIRGPPGAPGPQGATGPRGQKGKRGRRGYRGFSGKKGPLGLTGPQGHRGFAGRAFSSNRSVLINSLDVPQITTRPSAVLIAREGQNVVIPCEATGFPKPVITWHKNKQKVAKHLYTADGTLQFTGVKFADNGKYICQAKNFIGDAELSFQLRVNVVPRFVVSPPIYQPGYEDWDTTITCDIFGFPAPHIEWTRALQTVPKGRHIKNGKHLIIKKTEKADRGPYMCKGTNPLGSVFALIVLTVHPVLAPVIVESPLSKVAVPQIHSDVKLTCSARGSPLPNVEWSKDGHPLSVDNTVRQDDIETTGVLTIESFEPKDQGEYKCFFRNYENGTAEAISRVELVGCGDPGIPDHGYRMGQQFWSGKMVVFACDPGYHLTGSSNRLCLPSANWSNTVPTCHRMCKEPVVPENGYMIGNEFWANMTVEFKCKPGYWLIGSNRVECDHLTGNWTDISPECKGHTIYSDILANQTEYYTKLHEWLAPVTGLPTKWVTCYHTNEDGWAASTFHTKCNAVGPTITIIKVKMYMFGGYSDSNWHSSGSYIKSVNSFIFSFRNHDNLKPFKLRVQNIDNAMYGNGGYGPTFGAGHDIHIANNANSNKNSYINLGNSYTQLRGYKYSTSETKNLLAGSYNIQPDQIEVFMQTNE